MGVQIVLHEDDLVGIGKMNISEFSKEVCVIRLATMAGDLDVPHLLERCKGHEQIGCSSAHVFIIVPGNAPRHDADWRVSDSEI